MSGLPQSTGGRAGIRFIEAPLPYLAPTAGKPYRYLCEPPAGTPQELGVRELRAVRVWNGWSEASQTSLDVEGFTIGSHPTAFTAFGSEDAIRRDYYPEMAALALAKSGAERAIVFDHNVRHAPTAEIDATVGKPARLAHNDYTVGSGMKRCLQVLDAGDPRQWARRRLAILNLWRPILEPLQDCPLAVCDASSVAPQDLVASDLIYPDRRGEVFQLSYNPQHRWYYFYRQMRDEVLFIKSFDSLNDGRARFTPHTAFDDPTCPVDAPARRSIESRVLVIW